MPKSTENDNQCAHELTVRIGDDGELIVSFVFSGSGQPDVRLRLRQDDREWLIGEEWSALVLSTAPVTVRAGDQVVSLDAEELERLEDAVWDRLIEAGHYPTVWLASEAGSPL